MNATKAPDRSKTTWELSCEVYSRNGTDLSKRSMDKTIRCLTREEWIRSEEQASAELDALRLNAG